MRKTQKTAVVGGTVAVLLAGGVAFAAWTSTGTDSGTVAAGSAAALTVTGGSASNLYPTESKTFSVDVKNNNSYKVAIDSIALNGDVTVTGAGTDAAYPACGKDDVQVTVLDAATGTGIAGGATASAIGSIQVTMIADASNNCQNASFHVPVKATASSSN